MKKSLSILIFIVCLSAAQKRIVPILNVYDTAYGVEYSFETNLPDEQLYSIFFKYNHIQQYMQKTILTTDLLNETESENRINFHYNYLIAHLDMQIDRKINRNNQEVEFNMHSYYRSGKILPNVLNTTGHYAIRKEKDKKYIHYYQSTTLNVSIGRIYRRMILRENRKYLESLIAYIRSQEESHKMKTLVTTN